MNLQKSSVSFSSWAPCHLFFIRVSRIYSFLKSSFAMFAYYNSGTGKADLQRCSFSLPGGSSSPLLHTLGNPDRFGGFASLIPAAVRAGEHQRCKHRVIFLPSFAPFPLLFTYHLECLPFWKRSYKCIKPLCVCVCVCFLLKRCYFKLSIQFPLMF